MAARTKSAAEIQQLTPMQRIVAEWLAIGATMHEIAQQNGISVKTVDSHRGEALRKLGCRNNFELARMALREGWVTL